MEYVYVVTEHWGFPDARDSRVIGVYTDKARAFQVANCAHFEFWNDDTDFYRIHCDKADNEKLECYNKNDLTLHRVSVAKKELNK